MPWQPNTIEKKLEELQDNILKNAADVFNFSVSVNQIQSMPGVLGQGQATGGFGITTGTTIHQPVTLDLTDVDNTGTSTGTTNRISIKGTYMIIKHISTPIDLVWIDLASNNGQSIFLKPEIGKQLVLKTGGNIDISSDITIEDNEFVWLLFDEDSDVTSNGGFILQKINSGGVQFPILYPQDDFGDQGAITLNVDISGTTGQNKKVRMIGDVGFTFTNPPGSTVLQEIWITFEQDGVGGHSITTTPTGLKNAANLDVLLDKTANAKTTFRFITEDDGTTFRGELVDLSVTTGGASPLTTKGDLFGFTTIDARIPIGSNGQVLTADSSNALGLQWQTLSVALSNVTIDVDKSWLGFNITDIGSIGSNAGTVPGSGFIRMAATDQVRWKNILEDDDLYIDVQRPTLGVVTQDAFAFTVASVVQMYIGEFDISVEQKDIINTGDVLPSGTGGEVGDSTNFYNQMHSQFFIPEGAAVILGRYGLAKTGNTLYVNFDDTNVDAGFSIYEQGFESFRFYHPTSTVNEFHIGSSSIFTAGEEYAIQMGEGSANARIFFIEGIGNDLILDRVGAGPDQGVQIRGSGLTIIRFLSDSIKIFQPLDANAKDLFNVVDIKSNGGGGATTGTIGELITNDGGFNYFMRDTLAWESDSNVKLTFGSGGITLETNGSNDDIDILAQGSSSDIDIKATGFLSLGLIGINHLQFASGVTTFSNANLILATGAQEIQFLDAISSASATTPVSGDIVLFNDSVTGELSVKKSTGVVISLEGGDGADLSGIQDAKQSIDHETTQLDAEFWMSNTKQGDLNFSDTTQQYIAPATDQIYYMPIWIGERYRIERVGLDVASVDVDDFSMAIYDSYPNQNYPRNRITASTNTFMTANGIQSILFNKDVEPGLYWIAFWLDGPNSSLIRFWPGTSANNIAWIPTNGDSGVMLGVQGYIESGHTSSVLPSVSDDEMLPLYFFRVPAVFAKLIFNPN